MRFDHLLKIAAKDRLPAHLQKLRRDGLDAMIRGLNSVLPEVLLPGRLSLTDQALVVDGREVLLETFSQVIIVGGGKAAAGMCRSAVDLLGDGVPFRGAVNIPYRQPVARRIYGSNRDCWVDVTFCSHPIPDEAGLRGVEKMLDLIAKSPKDAVVLALISGGGSALMPLPAEGLGLEDKKAVNRILLACGAAIDEINCIRKHLSGFKGGRLSVAAYPRRLFSLILSDVIGNDLQTIASGPTVPDLTTFADADAICRKYDLHGKLPPSVARRLADGLAGRVAETPKPDPKMFGRTVNLVVGSAESSAQQARQALIDRGYACEIFSDHLHGEARDYGARLAARLPDLRAGNSPAAFIGTGEFTVTLRGAGRGGRNQEMLAGFLAALQENPRLAAHRLPWAIVSGAFDGIEGNSGAMGAVIDSSSLDRLRQKKIDLRAHLDRNDTRDVFESLGDLLVTGQTGTNVNDMTIILFA